ncbi:hypothetical protein KC363_g6417 [Hortaea werneckii]|nr:hypothetical protein KC325_g6236 [Hortaea werneckii]KAI6989867.1 hypothetical protein KC359_g6971 [Hortaea werneckii]KAI7143418.1 hypothetical protein KC344_g6309 [Hortaea werneckii]KAI7171073.1 hypothetical protein KC360_g6357 [Hortaea werneckii]KAI7186690.1 hypothetical protein KC363_g6417 [Hortaea werneckii]
MADWNVTVPINLPLHTITAIQNGEGIEAALSELAAPGLEGHTVVHDVARAIIDTVNRSAYRIISNSKSTIPPATYSHPTSKIAKVYDEYDSLSTPKGSFRSPHTHPTEDRVEIGGWSSPLQFLIVIRSTINKDQRFHVPPDTTVASLFDFYNHRPTVSGHFIGLRPKDWSVDTGCLNMSDTIEQAGLKGGAVLVAVEYFGEPMAVTFKDAMLYTRLVEATDLTLVGSLLLSYAEDAGHDHESLTFVVSGERELQKADYQLSLRDCDIKEGDLISVRPREQKLQYINIFVKDALGSRQSLTVREDAQTATLRSQYEAMTGFEPGKLRFSFEGISLMDGQLLDMVGPIKILHNTNLSLEQPQTAHRQPPGANRKPKMSLKTTVEIVADGRSAKCTVEVPLAAFSSDGDPCSVTNARMSDFVATMTGEVVKAVRRQDSDLDLENPATCAIDANVKEDDSWGTDTVNEDTVQKEGHLNFSQGSSAAPSPGDDVNKDWFRNARTEKFVEAQTALGLGNASSTLHPLQDGINEWGLRSSRDLDQPTSNKSYSREGDCTACDIGFCWGHDSRYTDSQEHLGDLNCGKSSVSLQDNVAQPSPSDWGRDDRISQSGGDWASGLGFAPSSDTHAGSHVEVTSVGAEVPDAQKIKVYVLDGKDAPANVKQYTMNLDCELSALLREVAWDFCRSPRSMKLSCRGRMVQPTDTPKKVSEPSEP